MAIYKELVRKISVPSDKKIKQKAYLKAGSLPVIDQGHSLIGGYTNDITKAIECDYPVIVFGDHTKCVKFITFPFAPGADGIKVLQPKEEILPKYLYYGTQYLTFRIVDKGYARHYQHIEKKELTVPSVPEQMRIASKIEELFSKLDASVAELQTAKEKLKVYRQAVLKEAFDPVSKESILLEDIIEKPRYGTSKKCGYAYKNGSKAVYRIPNICYQNGSIDHKDIKYADFSDDEIKNLDLMENDLLIIRSNGSVSLVGRSSIVRAEDCEATFAGYLIRLRLKKPSDVLSKFLHYFLESHTARTYIEHVAKSTSGVNNINSNEISNLPVPKCDDFNMQAKIVEKIETNLSICDSIEQTIDTSLQQAEALRQSILKQAFEGGL